MAETLRTKTVDNVIISFTDAFFCDDNEFYKSIPMFNHSIKLVRQEGLILHFVKERDFSMSVLPNSHGRLALTYSSNDRTAVRSGNLNSATFNYTFYDNEYTWGPYRDQANYPAVYPNFTPAAGALDFSTNIPVFETEAEAILYLNAETDEQAKIYLSEAINYKISEYKPEETKTYTYSCYHSNVNLLRGSITPTSGIGYRTLKIQANKAPAFYVNEGDFSMNLIVGDVIASIYAAGPESVVDNMPESQWTDGSLAYNGPFYCTLNVYDEVFGSTPGDGSYAYPTEFQTNIPIYGSREDAEDAVRTGDTSKAIRRGSNKEYDVKIGEEEQTTEFGGGGFMSPFMTILSGSKSDINRFKDVLFTDDQSLWDDIKKGLEMYGSNPIDYVISCKAFGFDVSQVVNESTRNDVWFGSYRHHFATAFNEVINMAHKYISAGSFFMYPIQYSYLDFEPYTTLSAWFPYHGWEQLDIKKYYQKQVEVRYYVDILTGQGVIITLCNGIITDQFGPCEMGTELPLTGANYAQWAQGQVRLLTQAASSLVGGISGGVTSGSVAGFAASSLTSLIPASQAIQGARQMGGPKNTMITKGNFGSNLGNYFPGYVIFRFDIHDMLEPNLLRPLVGRPSYSSGNVRDFSGFLSGKVVKLDTSGMTDAEAEMIRSLLKTGIYV